MLQATTVVAIAGMEDMSLKVYEANDKIAVLRTQQNDHRYNMEQLVNMQNLPDDAAELRQRLAAHMQVQTTHQQELQRRVSQT